MSTTAPAPSSSGAAKPLDFTAAWKRLAEKPNKTLSRLVSECGTARARDRWGAYVRTADPMARMDALDELAEHVWLTF